MKQNHKYRVNVYLGKEHYAKLLEVSIAKNIPLASIVKALIDTAMLDEEEELNHGRSKVS